MDECGFDRMEREAQAGTVSDRPLDAGTGGRSTAPAANIDVGAWAGSVGDPPLAPVFPDRLVDGAVILELTGRSYRLAPCRSTSRRVSGDPAHLLTPVVSR
jgi:hypothetical protein